MSSEFVLVLTTLPADADAPAFARALVEARLAACVNLLPPMDSVYRWQGAVERETERQVVIKTAMPRIDALWRDRNKARRMGEAGREDVARIGWDEVVARLTE